MISCVFIENFFSNLVLILYRVIHPARVSFGWWSCLCFLKVSHCLFPCTGDSKASRFSVVEVPWRMSCVDPLFIVFICIMHMFKLYPNL